MTMTRRTLKMGTRGSALARAQAGQIAKALSRLHPGLEIEAVVIETSGDRFASGRFQEPAGGADTAQGVKGLFVKEIEQALLEKRVDFAVHSAKDLPERTAPGLIIGAYPEREDPRDVFVGSPGVSWTGLPQGARIGTSSLRRKLQLLAARPAAAVVPLRGNVDTRLRKISAEGLSGIILAAAGLRRLGKTEVLAEPISTDEMVPAPGQGALAVEIREDDRALKDILAPLGHPQTRTEVECERTFSAAAGGGCSAPVGALAR
ncbi:MAG: hydroxymethylbilane synthase, partial [Elusimicrobia bacterium]|nr:hydroxymethylbilane synthase [Elusimicrobiota bacterium]